MKNKNYLMKKPFLALVAMGVLASSVSFAEHEHGVSGLSRIANKRLEKNDVEANIAEVKEISSIFEFNKTLTEIKFTFEILSLINKTDKDEEEVKAIEYFVDFMKMKPADQLTELANAIEKIEAIKDLSASNIKLSRLVRQDNLANIGDVFSEVFSDSKSKVLLLSWLKLKRGDLKKRRADSKNEDLAIRSLVKMKLDEMGLISYHAEILSQAEAAFIKFEMFVESFHILQFDIERSVKMKNEDSENTLRKFDKLFIDKYLLEGLSIEGLPKIY